MIDFIICIVVIVFLLIITLKTYIVVRKRMKKIAEIPYEYEVIKAKMFFDQKEYFYALHCFQNAVCMKVTFDVYIMIIECAINLYDHAKAWIKIEELQRACDYGDLKFEPVDRKKINELKGVIKRREAQVLES